jgi:hypothetical protein
MILMSLSPCIDVIEAVWSTAAKTQLTISSRVTTNQFYRPASINGTVVLNHSFIKVPTHSVFDSCVVIG